MSAARAARPAARPAWGSPRTWTPCPPPARRAGCRACRCLQGLWQLGARSLHTGDLANWPAGAASCDFDAPTCAPAHGGAIVQAACHAALPMQVRMRHLQHPPPPVISIRRLPGQPAGCVCTGATILCRQPRAGSTMRGVPHRHASCRGSSTCAQPPSAGPCSRRALCPVWHADPRTCAASSGDSGVATGFLVSSWSLCRPSALRAHGCLGQDQPRVHGAPCDALDCSAACRPECWPSRSL